MSTLHKYTLLFLAAFLYSFITISQVVVVNKLETPDFQIKNNSNRTQVWICGEWMVSDNNYVWEEGAWVEKRPGYIFLPGYWKEVKGGWSWMPGSWKSIDIDEWNNIYA